MISIVIGVVAYVIVFAILWWACGYYERYYNDGHL